MSVLCISLTKQYDDDDDDEDDEDELGEKEAGTSALVSAGGFLYKLARRRENNFRVSNSHGAGFLTYAVGGLVK